MAILEKSGLLSADEVHKNIAPVVIELAEEKQLDPIANENVSEKLGFIDWEVKDKSGQIQTKLGLNGAGLVGEFDAFRINGKKYGNKISYELVRSYIGSGMSSKTKKWIERIGSAEGISDDLVQDIKNSMNDLEDQVFEIAITQNEYITKTFTEGFAVTADFGPGSAVYDGKALFAQDHIIAGTGALFSNVVDGTLDASGGTHAPLDFANLKIAVEMLRNMKDGLGKRVIRPKSGIYDLVVSPENEANALDVLSDNNGFSPYTYAGAEASNENYANVFTARDGFKVRLTVLETMNQPDSENEGATIGSATMWFLINKEIATKRRAFRNLKFGELAIRMYEDDETRATFMTAEKFFGAQILYPEVIVGSKGDASAV